MDTITILELILYFFIFAAFLPPFIPFIPQTALNGSLNTWVWALLLPFAFTSLGRWHDQKKHADISVSCVGYGLLSCIIFLHAKPFSDLINEQSSNWAAYLYYIAAVTIAFCYLVELIKYNSRHRDRGIPVPYGRIFSSSLVIGASFYLIEMGFHINEFPQSIFYNLTILPVALITSFVLKGFYTGSYEQYLSITKDKLKILKNVQINMGQLYQAGLKDFLNDLSVSVLPEELINRYNAIYSSSPLIAQAVEFSMIEDEKKIRELLDSMPDDLTEQYNFFINDACPKFIQFIRDYKAYKQKVEWETAQQAERVREEARRARRDKFSRILNATDGDFVVDEQYPDGTFFAGCTSRKELIDRYKALVKKYHPDNSSGDTETAALHEEIFKMLSSEYSTLKSWRFVRNTQTEEQAAN